MKVSFNKILNRFSEETLNLIIHSESPFNEVQVNIVPDNYKLSYGYSQGINRSQSEMTCEFEIEVLMVQKMHEVSNYFKIGFEFFTFNIETKLLLDSKVIDNSVDRLKIKSPWANNNPSSLHSYERPLQFEAITIEKVVPSFFINLGADVILAEDNLALELYLDDSIQNGNLFLELSDTEFSSGPFLVEAIEANTPAKYNLPLPLNLLDVLKHQLKDYMLAYPSFILNFILEYQDSNEISHKRITSNYIKNPWLDSLVKEKEGCIEILKQSLARIDDWNKELEVTDYWTRFSINAHNFQAGLKEHIYEISMELGSETNTLNYAKVQPEIDKINSKIGPIFEIQNIDNYFVVLSHIKSSTVTKELITSRIVEMVEISNTSNVKELVLNYTNF